MFADCHLRQRHFPDNLSGAYALRFARDGKSLLTAGRDATIRLWDLTTGKAQVREFKDAADPSLGMAFSPDGKLLATGGEKGGVFLWDVDTGKQLAVLLKHEVWTRAITFSPDGKTLVSGSREPDLKFDKVPDQPKK